MFLREFLLPQPAINSKPSRSAQNPPTVPHDIRSAITSAERIVESGVLLLAMHLGVSFDAVLDQRYQSSRTYLGPFCPLAAFRLLDILPNMPASARLASEQNDLELWCTNFGNAGLGRLKELDYVARRVYAKNLFAPTLLHNVVPELHTIVLQLGDEGLQIVNSQDEPRPASRLGRGAIWH